MPEIQPILDNLVPSLLAKWSVPGVAVGVSFRGERALLGYGVTNVDHPLEVDATTIFQIGSISKTLLGVVISRLVSAGLLDLDWPVASLLSNDAVDQRITTRHLITHTSGIDGQNMIGDAPQILAGTAVDSIAASLRHFLDQPLRFAPGTDYSYSGPGFMLAAAVVEAVTGRPYVDTLQELALDPASMGLTFTLADQVVTHRVAAPHTTEGSAARVLRDEGWQRHWQLPAWDVPGGGVLSNARDLMRYGEYLMSEDAPVGVFDIHGHQGALGKSSGLAWTLSRVGSHVMASHDGLTVGYATNMTVVPSFHLSYCVLSNSVGGRPVVKAIEAAIQDALLGTHDRPNLDRRHPAELKDFAGTFDFGFYGMVRVGLVDDGLSMSPIPESSSYAFVLDPPTAELMVPSAADQLMILEPERHRGSLIGVIRDPAGRVVALNNGRIAFRVN
ncbi:MAG: hypothetical protein QOJ77_666 [Microbacteriaceae bacterium]|nr:hypothetical protein [Microbacteriaceae bacterium]